MKLIFAVFRPRHRNSTSGFGFRSSGKVEIYLHTKFSQDISIHGWDITTSGFWKQTTAKLEFYFRLQFLRLHHHGNVILPFPCPFSPVSPLLSLPSPSPSHSPPLSPRGVDKTPFSTTTYYCTTLLYSRTPSLLNCPRICCLFTVLNATLCVGVVVECKQISNRIELFRHFCVLKIFTTRN